MTVQATCSGKFWSSETNTYHDTRQAAEDADKPGEPVSDLEAALLAEDLKVPVR